MDVLFTNLRMACSLYLTRVRNKSGQTQLIRSRLFILGQAPRSTRQYNIAVLTVS